MVGVHSTWRSLRRMLMLPSLAAAKPLAYTFRPISQICSFSLYSFMFLFQVQLVNNTGTECVQRFFLRMKRGGRFNTFADADLVAIARAQVIQHDQVLA